MSRRTIAIIILIIGLLLLSTVGVLFIVSQNTTDSGDTTAETETDGAPPPDGQEDGGEGETTAQTEPTPDTSDTVDVVVSLQTVPRGHLFTREILITDERPRETVENNVFTSVDDVVGKYARTDIYQGQTLTTDKLVDDLKEIAENQYGPSSLIPPGFVAQSVPMDRLSGVAYGVAEGDYVDIMILFQMFQIDEEFQTLLPNDAVFFLEEQIQNVEEAVGADPDDPDAPILEPIIFVISPFGRFETLPTGDLAHISPRPEIDDAIQRPYIIGMIIQNAKVIQMGTYELPVPAAAQVATPTPLPEEEGAPPTPTPTPGGVVVPTATPLPPGVILVALQPQQQLLLRYALEVGADVDFALRGINDGQLYAVENLTLDFLLDRFNIEVPPNYGYTVDTGSPVTPTPIGGGGSDGGAGDGSEDS